MDKTFKLMEDYISLYNSIHENRDKIKQHTENNKALRKKLEKIKAELSNTLMEQKQKGHTLYDLCIKRFGKIDKRFYTLYSFFSKL